MIFRLAERVVFPNPELAEPDGLLAIGGDLSVARLLLAYQNGIFPWYNDDTPILWYSPHNRFVLYPDELKVSKSMKRILRSQKFVITSDTCFDDVITACSLIEREGQRGTWITKDMRIAYLDLHIKRYAHSFEVWEQGKLVGGLYGVSVGNVFCGESMFSLVSDASKTALIHLCNTGLYKLIDCQVHTDHLKSLGARMISRVKYLDELNANYKMNGKG